MRRSDSRPRHTLAQLASLLRPCCTVPSIGVTRPSRTLAQLASSLRPCCTVSSIGDTPAKLVGISGPVWGRPGQSCIAADTFGCNCRLSAQGEVSSDGKNATSRDRLCWDPLAETSAFGQFRLVHPAGVIRLPRVMFPAQDCPCDSQAFCLCDSQPIRQRACVSHVAARRVAVVRCPRAAREVLVNA